jgi:predicted  nucleic acid-binding Zn-ribbon protein
MTPNGAGLKQIHDLRLRLQEVTDELERGPRQIAARKQLLEKKKADVEERRTRLKQLKVAADQKNLQLKSNEAKIHDLQGKLNAATNNREFDALRTQIAADKMANSVLEDEILEALDGCDAAQREISEWEQEAAKSDAELAKFADSVKQREPDLKTQKAALEAQVADIEKVLPPEVVPQYRRLVQSYGARALSPVVGTACGECFVGQRQQTIMELRAGKFIFCTCGRLMYLAEEN